MKDVYQLDKEITFILGIALDNPLCKPTSRLQIFKTRIYNKNIGFAVDQHKREIMNALIYSKPTRLTIGNDEIPCMAGILEQLGRLPVRGDKINIIRGNRYFEVGGGYVISELWLDDCREND